MAGPALNQNFVVPAGDTATVRINVGPEPPGSTGLNWRWRAWPLVNGIPDKDNLVLEKFSDGVSPGITVVDVNLQLADIAFVEEDTEDLQGNYYHEMALQDALDAYVTVASGVMTVEPVEGERE